MLQYEVISQGHDRMSYGGSADTEWVRDVGQADGQAFA